MKRQQIRRPGPWSLGASRTALGRGAERAMTAIENPDQPIEREPTMTTITHAAVAERTGTTIPDHLIAQAEVPLAPNGWRQGDVYVIPDPTYTPRGEGISLTGQGHKVVEGDADRNSHILNGDGTFHPGAYKDSFDYGLLVVPEGGTTVLTHTGEHGSVAFSAGAYRVRGQVSYEQELRRAAD